LHELDELNTLFRQKIKERLQEDLLEVRKGVLVLSVMESQIINFWDTLLSILTIRRFPVALICKVCRCIPRFSCAGTESPPVSPLLPVQLVVQVLEAG